MLHEVLLALSGHPSPLFGDQDAGELDDGDLPLLTPSERALLRSLGKLSQLHRKLKRHLETIRNAHQSVICRSVASSMEQKHLGRFQQRILDVEERILKRDSSIVGAYEIVPLASVVGEFDDWHRRMAWYWEVAYFISPVEAPNQFSSSRSTANCTSAELIDKLRSETLTGFHEIEEAATELVKVAETAWLRQLSSWIVHGKLPAFGARDFFIQAEGAEKEHFRRDLTLLPNFVSYTTAASMLFIGKSLHQVQRHQRQNLAASTTTMPFDGASLAQAHSRLLASLTLPMVPSQLARIITDIRLSLSQNVLQHLIPISTTAQTFSCLRQFLLMSRGEFGEALIIEAEARLQARQQTVGRSLQINPVKALQGLQIKDVELRQALQQVWKTLAAKDRKDVDVVLESAQKHIMLTTAKSEPNISADLGVIGGVSAHITGVAFNDLLFPAATELTFFVQPPLDLLLSTHDIGNYTLISSYLLAIERGHFRLVDLWRRSHARRVHPASYPNDPESRLRSNKRAIALRKVWATCSAATFLLAETAAFLEAEVVRGSCNHFQAWLDAAPEVDSIEHSGLSAENSTRGQRDPETLAIGHRIFLAALLYALLLTDEPFTHKLRSLLGNIDHLIAFFVRLFDIHHALYLERDAGGESAYMLEEEARISLELDRARKSVDSDMRSVVNRLRQLNQQRIGSSRYLDLKARDTVDFQVWKGGGVDRLLMKLEFGTGVEADADIA
ncbi:hypothetical protein DOTSEDRAFT_56070 [Dothistroma septosporum NZE10]|uniref:Spindle pole body component n=1 Tax=Dothistroma septosporum (strain NZE10 / CBS 128990) TaxID=675120 RepID=N1PHJ2_DOTSN|nr:hypothetical protein DOTSEDRAFT_56070 [Dothistroma septosporum NZE10]